MMSLKLQQLVGDNYRRTRCMQTQVSRLSWDGIKGVIFQLSSCLSGPKHACEIRKDVFNLSKIAIWDCLNQLYNIHIKGHGWGVQHSHLWCHLCLALMRVNQFMKGMNSVSSESSELSELSTSILCFVGLSAGLYFFDRVAWFLIIECVNSRNLHDERA